MIQKKITLIQNLLQERTKKASQVLLPCQYHHQDRIKEEYGGEVDEVDEEDDVDHPPHPRSPPWRCCENTGVELPVYPGTELYCCVRSEPVNNTRNTFFFKFILYLLFKKACEYSKATNDSLLNISNGIILEIFKQSRSMM